MADANAKTGGYATPEMKMYHRAKQELAPWEQVLKEAHEMALPAYNPQVYGEDKATTDPMAAVNGRFDVTAPGAVDEKTNRLSGSLFPMAESWADFMPMQPSPTTEKNNKQVDQQILEISSKFHDAIEVSNFHSEISAALDDVQVSFGSLFIHEGTHMNPLHCEAVPSRSIIPVESKKDGTIKTNFRERDIAISEIKDLWPDAKLSDPDLARMLKDDPYKELTLVECTMYRPDMEYKYDYKVFTQKEKLIVDRSQNSVPGVMFRMKKAAGQTMGFGPVLRALPKIRVANKVRELLLANAGLAIIGLWQVENDGVLDPEGLRLVPGTLIPIAEGSSGIRPIATNMDHNLTWAMLTDLEDEIRRIILGPSLPPAEDSGRTAFELGLRDSDRREFELPSSLRLLSEAHMQITARVLHILSSERMRGSPYYIETLEIDGEEIKMVPMSPLVRLKKRMEADEQLRAVVSASQVAPDRAHVIVKRDNILRKFLTDNGVAGDDLYSEEETKAFDEQAAQQQAALAAAQSQQQTGA